MNANNDNGNIGWSLLGFFFPIIGLILYLVWKDHQPLNAKSAGKGALIGVIVGAIFAIIYGVLLGAAISDLYY